MVRIQTCTSPGFRPNKSCDHILILIAIERSVLHGYIILGRLSSVLYDVNYRYVIEAKLYYYLSFIELIDNMSDHLHIQLSFVNRTRTVTDKRNCLDNE